MVVTVPKGSIDTKATGTITSTQSVPVSTSGAGVVSFNVQGTWAGSVAFEATIDGTHWEPATATPILPIGPSSDSTTTVGQWTLPVGGFTAFRVRGDNVTSGAAIVNLTASSADSSIQQVQLVDSATDPGLNVLYNEITSVASGTETAIITLTATTSSIRIQKVDVSGENVAQYKVKINGGTIFLKRSWWGNFNQTFNFEDFANGLVLNVGQTLTVTAVHNRPTLSNFEVTLLTK